MSNSTKKLASFGGKLFSNKSVDTGDEIVTNDLISGEGLTRRSYEAEQILAGMQRIHDTYDGEEVVQDLVREIPPQQQSFEGSEWQNEEVSDSPQTGLSAMHPDAAGQVTPLIRSEFFKRVKRGQRRKLKNHVMASQASTTIIYSGEELNSRDQLVWMACLRLCRNARVSEYTQVRIVDLLKDLSWPDNSKYRGYIKASLDRFVDARIDVKMRSKKGDLKLDVNSHLLEYAIVNDEVYLIRLDIGSISLYNHMTYASWDTHKNLMVGGNGKADFYTQFNLMLEANDPHKTWTCDIQDLQVFWGFTDMSTKRFIENLRCGMELYAKKGFVVDAVFGKGLNGPTLAWRRVVDRIQMSADDVKELPFKAPK